MKDLNAYGGWALITGASAGIGREFARAIAAQGVDCVLVARRLNNLEELAAELEAQHGVKTRCVQQDLAAEGASERVAQAVADIQVGILVNNAGFGQAGRFVESDVARMTSMIRVNCLAPALLTHALLPPMLERGRGAVIMVSSILGAIPAPYQAVYGGTKAFDLFFGDALWAEVRGKGVDVITLCPSVTKTEFLTADGLSKELSDQAQAKADTPEAVVALALRYLGRKPTVGPWSFFWPALFTRLVPRKWAALISKRIMAKEMFIDQE
ncbi:MAG: SDR family NAD(P)-dependent oxidoreductase [bacterium]|nr:SDR family NAD(P)-dependent oxidoreductase [bacterium]